MSSPWHKCILFQLANIIYETAYVWNGFSPYTFIYKNAKISIGRKDLHFKSKENGKINEKCTFFFFLSTPWYITFYTMLRVSHCTITFIPKKDGCCSLGQRMPDLWREVPSCPTSPRSCKKANAYTEYLGPPFWEIGVHVLTGAVNETQSMSPNP